MAEPHLLRSIFCVFPVSPDVLYFIFGLYGLFCAWEIFYLLTFACHSDATALQLIWYRLVKAVGGPPPPLMGRRTRRCSTQTRRFLRQKLWCCFLFLRYFFLMISCCRLSWLPVSFLAHDNARAWNGLPWYLRQVVRYTNNVSGCLIVNWPQRSVMTVAYLCFRNIVTFLLIYEKYVLVIGHSLLPGRDFGMVCRPTTVSRIWFIPQTENVFNCSRHQCLVTVVFGRCV